MTTEPPLAELLRAAAENNKAQFECVELRGIYSIAWVLNNPLHAWKLVKKPVVTHEYYYLNAVGHYARTELDGDKIWTMHITITDGKRVAGFRE